MAQHTIVIIDDESPIRKVLSISLGSEEYRVVECSCGREGIFQTATQHPQLVIVDLGLPDIDGFLILKEIRSWSNVPVIILSVRNSEEDIVRALDLGADDYITKPFNTVELLARIRANIRRSQQINASSSFSNGTIKIDLSKRLVYKNSELLKLSNTEYHLLLLFFRNIGKVLTQNYILKEIWGPNHTEDYHYLRVFIGHLRKKIEDDSSDPKYIVTDSGVGYRMKLAYD